MQGKLILLHKLLNDIIQVANEDELNSLYESYRDKLDISSEDDVIYELIQDAQMLGKEILFLKSSAIDISRNRKIAALTAEEREELAEVEAIIDENRFGYHLQPIVNTTDGDVYSYEALMRPKSDMKITPFHILKYAELVGRLNDIERATFLNVLTIIDGNKEELQGRKVFINSIPKMKLRGSDFKLVGELLMKHSDTAVVEITEQAESDDDEFNELKERYMKMGVKIAIDDYGTGYSNVSNLLRYMPDYVKIDRSLISDIQDNPKKRHFVREIIEFCHGNGIMALAEGVETSDELRTVILLGADLIQGFYTSRPGLHIIDSIPYEIRQEIKFYQQERQDGKGQQIYVAETNERIQLDKMVNEDYRCILAANNDNDNEESEITIIGSPVLDSDVHIETAKDFKGKIVLENAHLSNVKNRPCIDLGENSDVTLIIKGENKLDKSGIRVPENAKFTLEGDGVLDIKIDAAEYFCIGNDMSSKHGDITLRQSGIINITASGRTGVCIGSGLGGNITINKGKIVLNINGYMAVGIGSLNESTKLDLNNCSFNTNVSLRNGVSIGSMSGNADVHIYKSSIKLNMSGESLVAVGTFSGDNAGGLIDDALVAINIRGVRCTCIGSLEKNTHFKLEKAIFRAEIGGKNALPFGSLDGDTKVALINVDSNVKMETYASIKKYLSPENIMIIDGRTSFSNFGEEIDLRLSE